ncbi:MAG: glycosyltransferase family 39 protein [Deltaproteobacteria bacterium]|nr:glycosyltransferase family 39 protein [Deltaproteobacteria bacterium]
MRYRPPLIVILIIIAAGRLAYIAWAPIDLSPDEAHYWEWSRRLALSYYSKGPLMAYVIAFFTALFGDTAFGVRAGAVVFSAAFPYLAYLLGIETSAGEKAGFYAALAVNAVPLFSIGSILMTTDVLLIFFWLASVYSVNRAVSGRAGWWYAAGVFSGLGFLAKYSMALIYPCVFSFLLFSIKERGWLKRKEPYLALLIGLVVSSPVLIWNIQNGLVTMKHTLGQIQGGEGAGSIISFLEFTASQAGLLTPFILAVLIYGMWRSLKSGLKEKDSGLLLIFFTSAPVLTFFLIKSLHAKVQANWAAISYAALFPAAVWAFMKAYESYGDKGKALLKGLAFAAVFLAIAVSFAAYFPWLIEPVVKKDLFSRPPFNRVTGWRELGAKVSDVSAELEKNSKTFIMSDTYQITSELAMYTKGRPIAYNINTGSRRMNQYDLWPSFNELYGYSAVYVKGGDAGIEHMVAASFDRCEKELFKVHYRGRPVKAMSIFRCYNFKGLKEAPNPERF